LQVGQPEVRRPVAPVDRAEEREQRGVLRDGQKLSVALRPAGRWEVEAERPYFAEEWVGYG